MGSGTVWLEFDGKLTEEQVRSEIQDKREENKDYNGHREGYSDDWQTIHHIEFYYRQEFQSHEEAFNYCADNAQKGCAIAVVFLAQTKNVDDNKKLVKMNTLIDELNFAKNVLIDKKHVLINEILTDAKTAKSKTIGCKTCESSINRSRLKSMGCPVCSSDLTSDTNKLKIQKLETKIKDAEQEKQELILKYKEAKKQILEKENGFSKKWLVAGWTYN